ncbi:MAG: hypothetical protein ACHQAY_07800 [Hyphomicrobiales bacterium]
MSDTDRRDTSSGTGAPKVRQRRGRAAASSPEAAAELQDETTAMAQDEAEAREPVPAPGLIPGTEPVEPAPPTRPASTEIQAAARSDGSSGLPTQEAPAQDAPAQEAPAQEAPAPQTGPADDAGLPTQIASKPTQPSAAAVQEEMRKGLWGSAQPVSPQVAEATAPAPAANRSLTLAALALSVLLPGALYAYLSANGVFDRDVGRLSQIESSLAALRAAPEPRPEVARADLDKLAARVDQLERAVATESRRPQSPAAAPSPDAIDAELQAASRDAKEALALAKTAAEGAKSAEAVSSGLALLETKIAALEKRLAVLEQSASSRPREASSAPSILIMARTVASDLSAGAPYTGELDALLRLGADPKLLEALRPFAEKGAPSPAALGADFETELNAARVKVADALPPASFWERITRALGQLVRVRRIGADDPGSPAATVEEALARGDVAAARDAWNGLPIFEKSATPVSGARIKALADAYDGVRRISGAALEAIRRSGSGENGG